MWCCQFCYTLNTPDTDYCSSCCKVNRQFEDNRRIQYKRTKPQVIQKKITYSQQNTDLDGKSCSKASLNVPCKRNDDRLKAKRIKPPVPPKPTIRKPRDEEPTQYCNATCKVFARNHEHSVLNPVPYLEDEEEEEEDEQTVTSAKPHGKQYALVVVAIDFGTTFSGYAYSFCSEYNKDHNLIYTNTDWKSGDGLITLKTPTAILFSKDGSFHSFGYEAEQNYAQFVDDNQSKDYIFLEKFKMKLFQSEQAGIPDNLLTLAYEPEAAAIYCKEMTVQRIVKNGRARMDTFKAGQKFLVLDCGGGTVDITSYEIQKNSRLKEIERPTGGPWGGTMVDNEYISFLKSLHGADIWAKFVNENPEDILDINRKFEAKKKGIYESGEIVSIQYPISFRVKSLKVTQADSCYSHMVSVKNDKLRLKKEIIINFFSKSVAEIIKHLKMILLKRNVRGIETILMVGGYSESNILYENMMKVFKHYTIICPPDANIAVMKGAVMFGHNPDLICERVCPRTYGIATNAPFDPEKHPLELKAKVEGKDVCTDIFMAIVKVGQPLIVGKSVFTVPCRPTRSTDCEATVEIYESILENPQFTFGKDVRHLGEVCIPIPDTERGKERLINVQMEFGYTEICVTVSEDGTNIQRKAIFKCLMS